MIYLKKQRKQQNIWGVPRSKLYVMALEDFISRHNGEMITKKLNEVYIVL